MNDSEFELRDCAWFKTDHPNDAEWDENDEPVVPAGRAVVSALGEMLRSMGIDASAPRQHSYYAWVVDAKRENVWIECMVQALDPWILLTIPRGGLFSGKKKRQLHIDVVDALQKGMNASSGFPEVNWATRDELADEGKFKR
jgi:hypothetical protein